MVRYLLYMIFCAILFQQVPINAKTSEVPLAHQLGQLILIGFKGVSLDEIQNEGIINKSPTIIDALQQQELGGIVLYDYNYNLPTNDPLAYHYNILNHKQLKTLIGGLQNTNSSKYPIFIAVDQEGGQINRLKAQAGFYTAPSAFILGRRPLFMTYNTSLITARLLSGVGINMNFAPVVDVLVEKNSIIGNLDRAFSADEQVVYKHAKEHIKAHMAYNVLTVLKHFPGHGSATGDSHLGFTDITNTWVKDIELFPYKELIKNDLVEIIMTAHVTHTELDEVCPATLSHYFLTDMLRNQLGYTGVVVTDDLLMGAITNLDDCLSPCPSHFSDTICKRNKIIQAAEISIRAGADIILIAGPLLEDHTQIQEIYQGVFNKLLSVATYDESFQRRVTESYKRVIALKSKIKGY